MLDFNVLMLPVLSIKGTAKTRDKGCMAMIVCERVSGNVIAFLLVNELSLA